MTKQPEQRMKVIKTGNLYLSYFTLGLATAITGPCLLDLQSMVNTDTRHIAWIYTGRSIGHLLGAIFGGVLLDLVRSKQTVLTISNFSVMATMLGISWSRDVELLVGLLFINGIALGAIETGGNALCLQLWGKDGNPFFQALHFSFGFGGLVAPLLAAPFLENSVELLEINNNSTGLEEDIFFREQILTNITDSGYKFENKGIPKVTYIFSIVGAIAFVVTISHLLVCIASPTEDGGLQEHRADNSDRNFQFMFATVVVTFLLFTVVTGTEIGYGQTLTTYAVKGKLQLSSSTGSYMTSAFWGSFTLSRLASVFLAMKFSCLNLIIGDIFIIGISALILIFLMPSEWALWLASIVFGMGIASAYAACVGWLDTHINVTNKISSIFTVGCATGQMVVPFIIAYYIDIIPDIFIFVAVSSCVLMAVFILTLHCIFATEKKTKEQTINDQQVVSMSLKNVEKI